MILFFVFMVERKDRLIPIPPGRPRAQVVKNAGYLCGPRTARQAAFLLFLNWHNHLALRPPEASSSRVRLDLRMAT